MMRRSETTHEHDVLRLSAIATQLRQKAYLGRSSLGVVTSWDAHDLLRDELRDAVGDGSEDLPKVLAGSRVSGRLRTKNEMKLTL